MRATQPLSTSVPSGPAAKSKKIKVKDRIVAVAQGTNDSVDVKDMPLNHVVDRIRGPKGTEVRLTMIPAGAIPSTRVTVSLIRDEINLEDQRAKAQIIEVTGADGKPLRLGVIDLPSFYASFMQFGVRNRPETMKSTTVDVAHLLIKLKDEGVSGVILDLRHNGGRFSSRRRSTSDGPVHQAGAGGPGPQFRREQRHQGGPS